MKPLIITELSDTVCVLLARFATGFAMVIVLFPVDLVNFSINLMSAMSEALKRFKFIISRNDHTAN